MRYWFLMLFFLLSASAHAQDPCATKSTTVDMEECKKRTLEKTEVTLNKLYKRVIQTLSKRDSADARNSETRELLIEAQRAWVLFRDKDCKAAYTYFAAGTIRNIAFLDCMQSRAEQRIKELKAYAEQ